MIVELSLDDVIAIFRAFDVTWGEAQGSPHDASVVRKIRAAVGDALPEQEAERTLLWNEQRKKDLASR